MGKIILPNINPKKITANWFENLMNELNNGNYQIEIAEKGKKFNIEDVEVKIINDVRYNGNNINNYSIVFKITYG